jgi:nicotinamidase-related amidase
MADFSLLPARTALINVDMQRCFVEDSPLASPDGPAVLQRINQLINACREAGVLIVHTRGWMRPGGTNLGVMSDLVPPFIVDLYTEGAGSAELHPDLDVQASDVVVSKPRYGGFHGTDLDLVLRSSGAETVIVSGIATNICCETTAREAAERDFRVVFLSDGTATKEMNGVPAADLQRATCASLGMVFAQIATVDEVIAKLAAGSAAPLPTSVPA